MQVQRRVSAVAYSMVDCYDIAFAVSAVKSMFIVRVGCCDTEAVCSVAESFVTRIAALRVYLAALFFSLGAHFAHQGFRE